MGQRSLEQRGKQKSGDVRLSGMALHECLCVPLSAAWEQFVQRLCTIPSAHGPSPSAFTSLNDWRSRWVGITIMPPIVAHSSMRRPNRDFATSRE